jgi:hypothetical protein
LWLSAIRAVIARYRGSDARSHTSYVWRDSVARNVAAPHNEFEWASDPDRAASADAAGSMITTAHDHARFLAHIITAEGRRKETVDWMLSWGLGWGLFEKRNGRAFFHTGHKGGAQNYVVAYIGDRDSPFDWLSYEPYDSTRRKPAPPRRIAVQVPAEVIAAYGGEYRFGPNASTFIKADAVVFSRPMTDSRGMSCSLNRRPCSSSKAGRLRSRS